MRRVITVSLNGNAYALEDDAAEALSSYLEQARRALENNADQAEILADLEQAIAEKSHRFLGAHKSVLSRQEISAILTELGPVDDDAATDGGASTQTATAPTAPSRKRRPLYRIRQGQQLGGVCTGLAAYLEVNVSWVRLAFLALTTAWGVTVLVYIALLFILPVADTPEELAAAYGEPFNARELVERARREAAEYANGPWKDQKAELKAEWERSKSFVRTELRASLRAWRERRVAARRRRRSAAPNPANAQPASPMSNTAVNTTHPAPYRPGPLQQVLAFILMLPLIALFGVLAFVWIAVLFALITTGTIFGILLPISWPIWIVVIALVVIFSLITCPLRLLRQVIAPSNYPGAAGGLFSFFESLVVIAGCIALAMWAYHHDSGIAALFDNAATHLRLLIEQFLHHGPSDAEVAT